jgi:predicted SprT family Zn-dependent metalloprotease
VFNEWDYFALQGVFMMKRMVISLICLASLLACCEGASGEWRRLSNADLHSLYQQINQRYFRGQLRDVPVVWADLQTHSAMGETEFSRDHIRIEVDPKWNRTQDHLIAVLEHEACHVYSVQSGLHLTKEQSHGPSFQACMTRYDRPPRSYTNN